VKQGDVVARVTPRPDRAAATALELKLKGLQARRAGLAEAPPARVREAKRALAAAQAAVDPLLKQHARLEGQKGPAVRKKLAAVDKALKPKLAALEKAKAGLEAATHAVARVELEVALARARAEQEAFTAAAGPVTVVSPAAGVLLWNPGQPPEVTSGTTLGQVVAPDLKVSLGDEAAEPGAVMVTVSGVAQEARAGRDGLSVEGGPALAGKPCTARLPGGRQPFVLTLF
jgi:multidrug resistance efflux pump